MGGILVGIVLLSILFVIVVVFIACEKDVFPKVILSIINGVCVFLATVLFFTINYPVEDQIVKDVYNGKYKLDIQKTYSNDSILIKTDTLIIKL